MSEGPGKGMGGGMLLALGRSYRHSTVGKLCPFAPYCQGGRLYGVIESGWFVCVMQVCLTPVAVNRGCLGHGSLESVGELARSEVLCHSKADILLIEETYVFFKIICRRYFSQIWFALFDTFPTLLSLTATAGYEYRQIAR